MALIWEVLKSEAGKDRIPIAVLRAKVPGGWLVHTKAAGGLTFLPDPNHEWDGSSPP